MPESEGGFKEFEIRDIFEVKSPSKRFNANAIKLGKGYPYVVRTSENNGIKGYTIQDEKYLCEGGTISFGQDTATIFFQEKPYFTGDKIKVMKCRDTELNTQTASYMLTALRKSFSSFSWGVSSFNEAVLNSVKIILPVKTNGNVDYQYMQHVIECIENDICLNVDKFLESNGYSDCTLTADERQARDLFMTRSHKMKEILLNRVFTLKGVRQSKCQSEIPSVANGIPYVVQSMNNNMCSRNVERQWLIDNNEPPQEGNTIVLGVTLPAISYQPLEFGASQVITARNPNLNESVGLYFAAVLRKHMAKFSYQNKPGIQKYKELYLCLPVTNDGSIDYDFMECYVNALKKQCIARLKASDMFSHDGINSMQIDLSKKDKSKINHKTTIVSNSDYKSTNNDSHVIKGSTLSYKDIVEPQQAMAAEDGC